MDPLADLMKCDYTNLQNVLRDILARLKSQEGTVSTLESIVNNKDNVIQSLTEQLKDNNSIINNLSSKFQDLNNRTSELEQNSSNNSGLLNNMNGLLNSLKERMDKTDMGGAGALSSSDIDDRLVKLESKLGTVDKLQDEVIRLEKDKLNRDEYLQDIQGLNDSISNIQQQINKNNAMLKDHTSELSKLTHDIESGVGGGGNSQSSALNLSKYVEKEVWENELVQLHETDSNNASEIRKLWAAIRKLKETDDELREAGSIRDSQISEMRLAIAGLGKLINGLTDRVNDSVDKRDLLTLREDMLKQLKEQANNLKEHIKKEMRRFESDLMAYMSENVNKEHTETALGKVYFRCLTCNQPTSSQHGPHSKQYQYNNATPATNTPALLKAIANGGMVIEKGNDVTVHGLDGQVYKGREDATVHFTSTSDAQPTVDNNGNLTYRNGASFRVLYGEKERGHSSMGSRGNAGISSNGGTLNRPQSARIPYLPQQDNIAYHSSNGGSSPVPISHLELKQSQLAQQFATTDTMPSAALVLDNDMKSQSMQSGLPSARGGKPKHQRPATTASHRA